LFGGTWLEHGYLAGTPREYDPELMFYLFQQFSTSSFSFLSFSKRQYRKVHHHTMFKILANFKLALS